MLSLSQEEINDVEIWLWTKTSEPGNYLKVRKYLTVIRDLLVSYCQKKHLDYLQFIYRLNKWHDNNWEWIGLYEMVNKWNENEINESLSSD